MKSTMLLLLFLLGSAECLAASGNEVLRTRTLKTLWLTFQTPDRMPTVATAKKITNQAFQNCERWRSYARKNFSTHIKKLPECEKSDGICGSRKSCVSYWAIEIEFNSPLTLINRSRAFFEPKSAQSMEACLKWIQQKEKEEGGRYVWSNCSYQEQTEENSEVKGTVESLPDRAAEARSRLLRHHLAQVLTSDVTIKEFSAASLEVRFPFTLRKSRGDSSDPEFKQAWDKCEDWRTRSARKLSAQGAQIEACRSERSVYCAASDPPTCYLAHLAKVQWTRERVLYTIDRTFPSLNDTTSGFEACYRWLKEEQALAPTETIESQCSLAGRASGDGKQTYTIKGTLNQTDLE